MNFWLLGIIVAIVVGLILVLRSPAPPPLGPKPPDDAELRGLRDQVLRKLQERLVAWTFEAPDAEPALLTGKDTGTEREVRIELNQLAARWKDLHDHGENEKAEELVEAFAEGVSGQQDASAGEAIDREAFTSALALSLVRPNDVPTGSLSRPAGPLAAMLVLRNPERPEPLTEEDLKAHQLAPAEAFETALANIEADAAQGVAIDIVAGTEDEPEAIRVAPGDPLAAAYVLTPALGRRLAEKHPDRALRLWPAKPDVLVALFGDTQPDALELDVHDPMSGPLAPDALVATPRA